MSNLKTDPKTPGGRKRPGKAFWLVAFAAVAVAGGLFAWSKNSAPPKLVDKVIKGKTFLRMKADYIYKSATGPEPISFNIVAGCSVTITRYITGDAPVIASRVPTMYARAMSDGAALGIEIPKICSGGTTENGQVPKDFLPAIVYYESAEDLSLGMLYASEDAYDGPISKLTFKGATIEKATAEEFQIFMDTEFKKNLISLESSRFARKLSEWPQPTEENFRNPTTYWKVIFPTSCYGVARLKMPAQLKSYLKQFWNPAGQRYWFLKSGQVGFDVMRALMNRKGAPEELYGTTFDGHPINIYRQPFEHWGTGIVTRNGGGSYAAVNPTLPNYIRALPPEYFPFTKNEGLPWLSKIESTPKFYKRNVLVGKEKQKGFLYCYQTGSWKLLLKFLKSQDKNYLSGNFPSKLYVDDTLVGPINHLINRLDSNLIFFDRDEYIYWMVHKLL